LGQPPAAPVEVLKTELSIEPIRADFVTFLSTQERILHLEFQVQIASEPPLPLRMLDYWVRLYRRHRLPITQVMILLRPPAADTVIETEFRLEDTCHRYRVVPIWEQDPEPLLQIPALLPLAVLSATRSPEQLLSQIAAQVSRIESAEQRQEAITCTQLLAGLRFSPNFIQSFFQEGIMRESSVYQEILQEGRQEGRQEGLQTGRQEGEVAIVLRLLNRRLGAIDPPLQAQIQALSIPQLEALSEALLEFTDSAALTGWLQENSA
jgi:predicted transposase/invertase (TIGR01784 family)